MELNTKEMSTTSDLIKLIMHIEHVNMVQLAQLLKSTPQNISQRLKHGNFRENDLIKIVEILVYEVIIEFRKNENTL